MSPHENENKAIDVPNTVQEALAPTISQETIIDPEPSASSTSSTISCLPEWAQREIYSSEWGIPLKIHEWGDYERNGSSNDVNQPNKYRQQNGWIGHDFCHDPSTSPVYISHYHVKYANNDKNSQSTETYPNNSTNEKCNHESMGIGTKLTGVANFTSKAESHKQYCHGGSMCAIMDDMIGWLGFCTLGKCIPWSGFTAQINTRLCKPIRVGTSLKLEGTIVQRVGRKVSIKAVLMDPSASSNDNGIETNAIHATAEGLFILNKNLI